MRKGKALNFERLENRRLLAADLGYDLVQACDAGPMDTAMVAPEIAETGMQEVCVDPIGPDQGPTEEAATLEPAISLDLADGMDGYFGSLDADKQSETLGFTANADGMVDIVVASSFGDQSTNLQVTDGEGNLIAATETEGLEGFSTLSFAAKADQTYELTVSSEDGGQGNFQVTIGLEAEAKEDQGPTEEEDCAVEDKEEEPTDNTDVDAGDEPVVDVPTEEEPTDQGPTEEEDCAVEDKEEEPTDNTDVDAGDEPVVDVPTEEEPTDQGPTEEEDCAVEDKEEEPTDNTDVDAGDEPVVDVPTEEEPTDQGPTEEEDCAVEDKEEEPTDNTDVDAGDEPVVDVPTEEEPTDQGPTEEEDCAVEDKEEEPTDDTDVDAGDEPVVDVPTEEEPTDQGPTEEDSEPTDDTETDPGDKPGNDPMDEKPTDQGPVDEECDVEDPAPTDDTDVDPGDEPTSEEPSDDTNEDVDEQPTDAGPDHDHPDTDDPAEPTNEDDDSAVDCSDDDAAPTDLHANERGPDATEIKLVDGSGEIQGDLETVDDKDVFRFTSSANGEINVFAGELSEDNVDLDIKVYDGDGNLIVDGATNEAVKVSFTAEKGSEYFVSVESEADQTGSYDILVEQTEPADDHADVMGDDSTLIEMKDGEGNVTGTLEEGADKDSFRVVADADGEIVLNLQVTSEDHQADAQIAVYADGQLIADGTTNESVGLRFDAAANTQYHIVVESLNDTVMNYELASREFPTVAETSELVANPESQDEDQVDESPTDEALADEDSATDAVFSEIGDEIANDLEEAKSDVEKALDFSDFQWAFSFDGDRFYSRFSG